MNDYEPLDISAQCNADLAALGDHQETPIGDTLFRGLPFKIGGNTPGQRLIVLDGSSDPVTIPVGKAARRLIFAHRLLESDVQLGGFPGGQVADYVFHLSVGQPERHSIRELFEIGAVPYEFGRSTYRAVSDSNDRLFPRYEGNWEAHVRRQTEAEPGRATSYLLWAWENPNPSLVVESVEIVPHGPKFALGGVTLGHADEHPFVLQGRREVRIDLTNPEDAVKPSDVEVQVDRGSATYVHALPAATVEEFIEDSFKGWGEPQNDHASPAYVEIAATPSATISVRQDGEDIGQVNWGEVQDRSEVATSRVKVSLLDRGRNWVHVKVLDDDTGRPVPCRVHFRSPEGIPYQPHGHHNQVNSNLDTWHADVGGDVRLGQITYAYIDGTCQGWLPRGDVLVDVARGFEYEPLRTRISIEPGQQELTLRLKRWIDMNAAGWYSGDSHVHFLSTQGAHTESMGEDLNVVNLLQSQWGSLFTNTEDFTGKPSISQEGDNIIYVGQENRQHFLGHMLLWGLKRPVMPWCTDGLSEAEMGGTMETTMSHWADEARAQGGTVIIPHFPGPNGEPAALIATDRVDGVEMIGQDRLYHAEYYRYLNCGYRLPLIGGTDKMGNDVPVGTYRTYAKLPDGEDFTYDGWCRAVAAGRTILSGGPIIGMTVEGSEVGDTVKLSGPGTVEVHAWSESILPMHSLELVMNGRVIGSTQTNGARRLEINETVNVDGHSWIAARCGGPDHFDAVQHHDVQTRGVFAHTSPVYLACGGEWQMFDEQVARYMLTLMDGSLTYIRENAPQRDPGTVTHHHGEADHLAYLERPFLEGQAAVHRRLHDAGIAH